MNEVAEKAEVEAPLFAGLTNMRLKTDLLRESPRIAKRRPCLARTTFGSRRRGADLRRARAIEALVLALQRREPTRLEERQFQKLLSSGRRVPLSCFFSSTEVAARTSLRRTSSTASCTMRWTWMRSKTICACGEHSVTALMYAPGMSIVTASSFSQRRSGRSTSP